MSWRVLLTASGLTLWVVGLAAVLDLRFPLDLSRFEDRSVVVTSAEGEILRPFLSTDDKWRLYTTVEDVDPEYLRLLKQVEDQRFDRHAGVDPFALSRAVVQLIANGRVVSGASTLTMQTARLLEPRPRTLGSKLVEMARAFQLETRFSKRDILNMYLTLAPFGGNIEGVRAASLAYFGKEPKRLTLSEAALLIALPQRPEAVRPDRVPNNAGKAREKIVLQLLDRELISQTAAVEALEETVPSARHPFPFVAPRFARYHKTQMPHATEITTTVQAATQRRIEALIRRESDWIKDGATIAILAVDNETRNVIAYAGGGDFWGDEGQLDLIRAKRSPGSALKPFVYGMAFDDLVVHPDSLIEDRPTVFGSYAPRNFNRTFQGTVNVRTALRQSLNVPAVALLDEVGPIRLASLLRQNGAKLQFAKEGILPSLPLALGGVGISLYDLTSLYVAIANGGVSRPLQMTADGSRARERRLMGEVAAWYVTDTLLGSPMPDGWAQRFGFKRNRTVAFKTGTSYGFRDAWAVGYTGSYTIGVWVGRADGTARPGRYGLETAAPVLLKAFEQMPPETRAFPEKPANVISVRSNRELPVSLQKFDIKRASPQVAKQHFSRPPVIRFPANGTAIAMPSTGENETLPLRVVGGEHPYRWMVNGKLLPRTDRLETTYWKPTLGFANLSVIDSQGRAAHATVRIVSGGTEH